MGSTVFPAVGGISGDKWNLISSVAPSGTTVTFSGISGYRKLALVLNDVNIGVSACSILVRFNGDSGANNYRTLYITSASATLGALAAGGIAEPSNQAGTRYGVFYIESADSVGYKPFTGWSNAPSLYTTQFLQGCYYLGNAAISSVSFTSTLGATLTGTNLSLYGVLA